MKDVRTVWGSLSALFLAAALIAQAPQNDVDTYIANARAAAGTDVRDAFINLCLPPGGRGVGAAVAGRAAAPPAAGRRAGGGGQTPDRGNWYALPFKIFDNFYWLGTRQHSSWALQTSAGMIVLDTNFAWATEPEIIEGLTTLGLNRATSSSSSSATHTATTTRAPPNSRSATAPRS